MGAIHLYIYSQRESLKKRKPTNLKSDQKRSQNHNRKLLSLDVWSTGRSTASCVESVFAFWRAVDCPTYFWAAPLGGRPTDRLLCRFSMCAFWLTSQLSSAIFGFRLYTVELRSLRYLLQSVKKTQDFTLSPYIHDQSKIQLMNARARVVGAVGEGGMYLI